ncbi:putative ribonuclease H-like domain-containing protein [Tanacetum coccineum]
MNEPVKSDKQAVKPRMVTQSPKVDRKDWNGKMTQKLGLVLNTRVSKEKVNTVRVNGVNIDGQTAVSTVKGNTVTAVKASAGNKALLTDYQDIDGGFVAFGKSTRGGKITGLPSKTFENDHTFVACQKGKQHKASCKTKLVSSISQPLQMLHMDLFGPTSVRSINHKTYFLVVTDDFSRFSWVFFLATKSESSGILKNFIIEIENQLNHKVKVIMSDNGTKFKSREMDEFCGQKGIKREYSIARTPQQNEVAKRKNKTLIEAARTMLPDSLLPIIAPSISFMRPFGCPVTILNILNPLGKFDGKAEEGFLVRYSVNSKAFRVFNTETRKVEENLHVNFLKNKPNIAGQ